MSKMNFIKTSDKDTALLLRQQGFVCIGEDNNVYTFINSEKIQFDGDKSNVTYTNIINV